MQTNAGFVFERDELVRVMVQALNTLGCKSSAAELERESGIKLERDVVGLLH